MTTLSIVAFLKKVFFHLKSIDLKVVNSWYIINITLNSPISLSECQLDIRIKITTINIQFGWVDFSFGVW